VPSPWGFGTCPIRRMSELRRRRAANNLAVPSAELSPPVAAHEGIDHLEGDVVLSDPPDEGIDQLTERLDAPLVRNRGSGKFGMSALNGQEAANMDILAAARYTGDEQKNTAKYRDIVAGVMTPAQIAEAKRLTQQCQARQFKRC